MSAIADRVDAIEAGAVRIDLRRATLTALVAVPYALGWTTRKVFRLLAVAASAIRLGWNDAGPPKDPRGRR